VVAALWLTVAVHEVPVPQTASSWPVLVSKISRNHGVGPMSQFVPVVSVTVCPVHIV
jgi:hypothetical protein